MAQIILKGIGSDKVKVIKLYREVTGLGLKEAKEAVDGVEAGQPSIIDGINAIDIQNVIDQFIEVGAEVYKGGSCEVHEDFISAVDAHETDDKPLDSDTNEVEYQRNNLVASRTIENMSREETLNLLLEVASVARQLEQNSTEIKNLNNKIKEHNAKVQGIRDRVSFKSKVVIFIGCFIVLASFGLVGLFGIVVGIIVFLIVARSVGKDCQKHHDEYEAEAQEYIHKNIDPLNQRLEEVQKVLEELNNSGKIEWAIDVVGRELFNSACVEELYSLVKGRRADSLKEALNLYDSTKHRERMEAMQEAIQYASQISAMEASKQTEAMKEIEKSTQSAARTAKVNAAINYGTYRNAKKINKKLK